MVGVSSGENHPTLWLVWVWGANHPTLWLEWVFGFPVNPLESANIPRMVPKGLLCRDASRHVAFAFGYTPSLIVRNFWITHFIRKLKICSLFYFLRAIWICINILCFCFMSWGGGRKRTKSWPHLETFLSIKIFEKERHEMIIVF